MRSIYIYIDIYLLHRDDPNTPVEEFIDTLNEAKEVGKKSFGVSNWTHQRIETTNRYTKSKGLKIPVLILGCVLLAFGMTIVIRSEAGTRPNDLVAVVITEKGHSNFGLTRVITDSIFVLAGFIMGGKLGIGSVSGSCEFTSLTVVNVLKVTLYFFRSSTPRIT